MSEDTLSRIAAWCAAADDLEMEGSTVTIAGDPPIEVQVDETDEAVTLTHRHAAGSTAEGFAEQAAALVGGRGSMLEGDVAAGDDGTRVDLRYPIYLDGLNRQTFLLAIRDITAAADALTSLSGPSPAPEPEPEGAAAAPAEGEPAGEESAAPAVEEPTDQFTPAAEAETETEPAAAQTVVLEDAPWVPTHTVPGGGISAWAEPDPSLAPAAKLAARVELRVDESRGAWARVTGSNGWTGWVDGRKLRPLGAARPGPAEGAPVRQAVAPASPFGSIRPLQALGGLAMIIAAFIPWNARGVAVDGSYRIPVGSTFDWPLAFLANRISPGQPRLGVLILLLGIAVVVMAVLPRVPFAAIVSVAVVSLIVGLVFLFQLQRAPGWGDTFKILEAGFWVYLVGTIVAAVPLQLRS